MMEVKSVTLANMETVLPLAALDAPFIWAAALIAYASPSIPGITLQSTLIAWKV